MKTLKDIKQFTICTRILSFIQLCSLFCLATNPMFCYAHKKKAKPYHYTSATSSSLSPFVKVAVDTLLIVESPAKCSTILKHLGPGYRCIATMGHMRHLDGLDSVDIKNNYKLNFTVMESKKTQIKKIQDEIKSSAKVVIATDDDREGESIAWHICELFHLPIDTTERIVFHEITKDALGYAVKHPKRVNMSRVYSAHARQVLDLLIGYKISPLLWKHVGTSSDKTLSAGRCQTPALRIVYENELERFERLNKNINDENQNHYENQNHEQKNEYSSFYSVVAYFTKLNLPFSLESQFETRKINDLTTFLNASIHENTRFTFKRDDKLKTHTLTSPNPFTTSRLQQAASNDLSFSPSETMEICQTLYERGYITYIRTTGTGYSADFINRSAFPFIRDKWGPEYIHTTEKNIMMCNTAAHEAIRPTDVMRFALTGDYHPREQKIYKLIWKNTVESCMSEYTYSSLETAVETNIVINEADKAGCGDRFYTFLHTCVKPIFYGWKAVQIFMGEQVEERDINAMDYLLSMRNVSEVSCNKIETKVVFSSVGKHYTEARLIQSLEEKEIGRPSTFSTIIEKIKERDYVKRGHVKGDCVECVEHTVSFPEKKLSQTIVKRDFGNEKNKLCITSLGKAVCVFLITHFPRIFSYEYTKQMEAELDNIASQNSDSATGPLDCLKRVCDECCREIGENIHNYNSELQNNEKKEKIEKIIVKNDDKHSHEVENMIGIYCGFNILLKNGRFGKYIVWGKDGIHRKSIEKTHLQNKDSSSISLDEVIRFIENDSLDYPHASISNLESGIIRIINDDASIRSGKYGNYIFYKTAFMKKPKFISLKNFNKNIYTCSETDLIALIN